MSVTLGAVIVILLLFAYRGHSKGIVMEITSLISVALSLLGLALIVRMVGSYLEHKTSDIVQAAIFFVALAFLYQIIRLIIVSLKIVTSIPIIHGLNSLIGMIVGIVEGVLVVWALFIIISRYDIAGQSEVWLKEIAENPFLSFLSSKNPFAGLF